VTGPVVGIAAGRYAEPRPWGELPIAGIPPAYVASVAAAGGLPVILPVGHAVDLLDVVDGVVLAGGVDLGVDPDRDAAEVALVVATRERGLPLLGVCRGLQVIAVTDGGSLLDDVPHVLPGTGHPVSVSPGSLLHGLVGPAPVVSSLHHQAPAQLSAGWRVTARAGDGVVEAAEWSGDGWPALGVQWHPEMDATGPALFGWLVGAARQLRREMYADSGAGIWAGRSPQS
jgi:putative glutamine amidotransferase